MCFSVREIPNEAVSRQSQRQAKLEKILLICEQSSHLKTCIGMAVFVQIGCKALLKMFTSPAILLFIYMSEIKSCDNKTEKTRK